MTDDLAEQLEVIAPHLDDYHCDDSGGWSKTLHQAAARIRELEREREVLLRILRSGSRCRRDRCTRQADWVVPEQGFGAESGHTWGKLYCSTHLPDSDRDGAVNLCAGV